MTADSGPDNTAGAGAVDVATGDTRLVRWCASCSETIASNTKACPLCGAPVQEARVPVEEYDEAVDKMTRLPAPGEARREPFSVTRVMTRVSARITDFVLVGIPFVRFFPDDWPYLYLALGVWEFGWVAAVRATPVKYLFGMRVAGEPKWRVSAVRAVVLYGPMGVLTAFSPIPLLWEIVLLVAMVAGFPIHDLVARTRVVWKDPSAQADGE